MGGFGRSEGNSVHLRRSDVIGQGVRSFQNAILICGYYHCHRKLRKPLYDQRFPVSFLQAEDTPTMTKDYTPKNTDFVWNGDESKHTEARKMLARKVREKFGTIGDWYTIKGLRGSAGVSLGSL